MLNVCGFDLIGQWRWVLLNSTRKSYGVCKLLCSKPIWKGDATHTHTHESDGFKRNAHASCDKRFMLESRHIRNWYVTVTLQFLMNVCWMAGDLSYSATSEHIVSRTRAIIGRSNQKIHSSQFLFIEWEKDSKWKRNEAEKKNQIYE